ncbi:MAG: amino acid adenylation domain-containing protein [Chloroflexota bacterium]
MEVMPPAFADQLSTIVDLVQMRALKQPERCAYIFLEDGENEESALTYGELDQAARKVAVRLQAIGHSGDRVLLLYPPGLEYIAAFYGCLYAGKAVVPSYPPRLNRPDARLQIIATDSRAAIALTTTSILQDVKRRFTYAPELSAIQWLATDTPMDAGPENWQKPELSPHSLAFLQYTSGSTANPKGVMLTHENLLSNSRMICTGFEHTPESKGVIWLPPYHDMGLIGGILQPLYVGFPTVLMSPTAFLQSPIRWLRAISRYQATTSGGPNFAYDLCVEKTSPEQLANLDLSHWDLAFTGAEPVREGTLERFSEAFGPCGFRREAFYPCYGLAEATLIVSGGKKSTLPRVKEFDKLALEQNHATDAGTNKANAQALVGCGNSFAGQQIAIVNPQTCLRCETNQIGEIWVAGPSVAKGYWDKPRESAETFQAYLSGTKEGPFLRTGDLGFIKDGELFVTGRLKDLIIIRGRNLYPQDIELAVEQSHPGLRPGGCAAFPVDVSGQERLVIVQELERHYRRADPEEIFQSIRQTVAEAFTVQVHSIVLINPGSLPKTSSGKVQRHACRKAFIENKLEPIASHTLDEKEAQPELSEEEFSLETLSSIPPENRFSRLGICLQAELAKILQIPASHIALTTPLTNTGLDSLSAVQLANILESRLGISMPMADLLQGCNVEQLVSKVLTALSQKTGPNPDSFLSIGQPETYPLSIGQEALWFINRLAPESAAYNLASAFRVRGLLDLTALEQSFQAIVNRHVVLRTTFHEESGKPQQRVQPRARVDFQLFNARNWTENEIQKSINEEAYRPFDLESGPLFRVRIFLLTSEESILLVSLHHIISDFWSLAVLFHELNAAYEAAKKARMCSLPALPASYASFVAFQRAMVAGSEGQRLWTFWQDRLSGKLPVLDLPVANSRPPLQTYCGATYPFTLGAILSEKVRALGLAHGATLFTTLLAIFQTLLYRYSGQEDILIGSPTTGRNRADFAGLAGYFVNPIVLRARIEGNPRFTDFLQRVRQTVLDALAHQDFPFPLLVERLQPERDPSRSPLFQVTFAFQKAPRLGRENLDVLSLGREGVSACLGDVELITVALDAPIAQFDLSLAMSEIEGEICGTLEYNTDLFEPDVIERLIAHFQCLIEGITTAPSERLSNLPLLTAKEQLQLEEWNSTQVEYPHLPGGIHRLFERQVERTPDSVAIVFEGQSLTYAQLNQRANQLAHYLQGLGVGPEILVGICLERSLEIVIAIQAVLKAGGAYVPLDPSYPVERLAFMLADANVPVLLTQSGLLGSLSYYSGHLICLDQEDPAIAPMPTTNPASEVTCANLAYVIYTSGSTGRPKGAMNSHRAIYNRLFWMQKAYGLTSADRVLQKTPFSFDVSVWEFFWPLLNGACLVIAPPEAHQDSAALVHLIAREKITILHFVPSMLRQFLEEPGLEGLDSVRHVICSGEALGADLLPRYHARLKAALHNLYGPTEAAVEVTYWDCPSQGPVSVVPIGKPIDNLKIYLLDGALQRVPVGVPGEIHIGGVGLGRGYWNRPELTAEKFVPNPFTQEPGQRLYRTGDLARYLPDGNIEFLGRMDFQIKLRGFRIELGEIEAALNAHPLVQQAVVLAIGEGTDKRLVAYWVCKPGDANEARPLQAFLQEKLPVYMQPSTYVVLDRLPLTASGKVDRRALPVPETVRPDLKEALVLPRTATEEILAGIWSQVLKLPQVGVNDNFFDLGGHSLLATQVISRLRQAFQVELPLRVLFEAPTVAGIAGRIQSTQMAGQGLSLPSMRPVPRKAAMPLSFAQQRLWFLDQLEPNSPIYNLPGAVRLRGTLNVTTLEQSLNEIVRRHEDLRTIFTGKDGQAAQVILPELHLSLPVLDLSTLTENQGEARVRQMLDESARQPFDLSQGPLIRASLLRLAKNEHVLLLSMHHIISDGWSLAVLIREVSSLYKAYLAGQASPLPELPVQYADFAVWQREWLQGEMLDAQLAYWKKQLSQAPILELPTDRPRPAVQTYRGEHQSFALPGSVMESLKAFSREENATLFMTLLAAFQTLLYRYSGQEDVCVGSPVANRNHRETEGLIGFFANTLVLRSNLSGSPTFRELLRQVRETSLGAYAHQDVPFEMVVEAVQPERNLSRSPLFQVMFALQNAPVAALDLGEIDLAPLEIESKVAKFDLTLSMIEDEHGLQGTWEYNADLFNPATIQRMGEHFRVLLDGILAGPECPISRLPLLTPPEQQQLLVEWNNPPMEATPQAECIHRLFEVQATQTPQAPAVVFRDQILAYRELNEQANRLAFYLCELGVGPETLVGVCAQRTPKAMIALLGIHKAGGAYLPIDPGWPDERLAFILADTQISIILVDREWSPKFQEFPVRVVCLDEAIPALTQSSTKPPNVQVNAENLAYVIYTSGSTGKPKGVAVTHRGIGNLAFSQIKTFGAHASSRSLQFASLSFDASVSEIWVAWLSGSTLYLPDPDIGLVGTGLEQLIRELGITLITLPPSVLSTVDPEAVRHLETVVVAGEACPDDLAQIWSQKFRLINAYGPTETSVCATMGQHLPGDPARSIGKAIPNFQVYVLDEEMQPTPVGVPGELYLCGVGLARGYWNRPDLTAERFLPNPFATGNRTSDRLFRTGDRARYLSNGKIEFMGRLDHQVKIRGFRIELEEIEASLREYPGVQDCRVLAHEMKANEKRLIAYVVMVAGRQANGSEIQVHLKKFLPTYMIPSAILFLDALPLNHSGKIDRQRLPTPDWNELSFGKPYTSPRSPTEETLVEIWSQILDRRRVSIHDNFFELGGHSLLATQVISRLRSILRIELPLRTLFEFPTIAGLAAQIESARQSVQAFPTSPIAGTARQESLPLSFAQQRLWFLNQLVPDNPFYNIAGGLHIRGPLQVALLERSLSEIIRRHEALRTTFLEVNGQPAQVIAPATDFHLSVIDLQYLPAEERDAEALHLAKAEALRPFDLATGPLLRSTLIQLGHENSIILLTIHHIISDGWSMGVFFREMMAIYSALAESRPLTLPDLPVQYADFAAWQRHWLQGTTLGSQLDYWMKKLSGPVLPLNLPIDHPRPAAESFRGASRTVTFPPDLARAISELSSREGATLFMTLLAAFQVLMYRYTGQVDISIGSPIANRNRSEIEGLIGFFVNTLVLRSNLNGLPTFREFLGQVKETTLNAYANQDLPFELLVEAIQPERDLTRQPLFQIIFALQNAPIVDLSLPGLTLSPLDYEHGITRFDLEVYLWKRADQSIDCQVIYSADLFDEPTITRLLSHYQTLLAAVAAAPDQCIATLPFLSSAENQQLLSQWNRPASQYPRQTSIQQLFEDQVSNRPEEIALISEARSLTYNGLNENANRLANYLRELGVGPDVRVALCLERSPEMIVAILGILKAGGAYVPLDPTYPSDRLAWMLADLASSNQEPILITQATLLDLFPGHSAQVVCLDRDGPSIARHRADNPECRVAPENLAYIMYTSGSTGTPKGIEVTQRGVVRLVQNTNYCSFSADEVFLQLAPISFDASTLEIWGALLNGGKLALYPAEQFSLEEVAKAIAGYGVTTLWLTAGLFHLMVDEYPQALKSVRQLLAGGDVLSVPRVKRVLAYLENGHQLINGYGPTENTTFTCCYRMAQDTRFGQSIPIGRPIANSYVYVLDEQMMPVPVGIAGELYIGGDGLARGYFRQPGLTAEKFVPDLYSHEPGARIYKTGDRVRFLPDGNLEFLGRLDQQIKIRGFRIEPGEVETVLKEHPSVRESAVIALPENPADPAGNKKLVAYIVPKRERQETSDVSPEMEEAFIERWQMLYDDVYSQPAPTHDPTFNITGWNSSYTGAPIPAQEMHEWLNHTVERILSLHPARVLEIGCGTGLLLFQIAPHCHKYLGTDFSSVALEQVRQQLATQDLSQVCLHEKMANDFSGIEAGKFDTVIINSVTQYFPDLDYLAEVLEGAVNAVADGGSIFVGDVRNLPLLQSFHTSVEFYRAPSDLTIKQLKKKIERDIALEQELVIDPAFFTALKRVWPRVSQVEIYLKRGRYHNELTRFRYDVILRIDSQPYPTQPGVWLDWEKENLSLVSVGEFLRERKPALAGIKGVPNARLKTETHLQKILSGPDCPPTVGATRAALQEIVDRSVDPEEFWRLGEELDYRVEAHFASGDLLRDYDVIFRQRDEIGFLEDLQVAPEEVPQPWNTYANDPLQNKAEQGLIFDLKDFLAEKLPPYLVPSAFVLLESLPLNSNGKLDRRALPNPDDMRTQTAETFVAPRNEIERILADTWQKLLGLEKVGIHDNFFDLGGHSLLAAQLVSRLRQIFEIKLPLRTIFENGTIARLAEKILTDLSQQVDQQTLADLDELSPEEVRKLLEDQVE